MSLGDALTACISLLVPTSLAFITFRVRGRYGERLSVSLSNLRALTDLRRDELLDASEKDVSWAQQEVHKELKRLQAPRFRRVDSLLFIAILALIVAFGWSIFFPVNVVFSWTGWGSETFWPINTTLCAVSMGSFGLWLLWTLLSDQGQGLQTGDSVPVNDDAEETHEEEHA